MYLHFIGRNLYGIKRFIREARKYGVQRAMPPVKYKNLQFGDRILLAVYNKTKNGNYAVIFGYFIFEGIAWEYDRCIENFIRDKLKIVSAVNIGSYEERYCGSYTLGTVYEIENDYADLINIFRDAMKRCGKKVKIFYRGTFFEFRNYIAVPSKFTRGLKWIETDEYDLEFLEGNYDDKRRRKVYILRNYKQRQHLTQKDVYRLEVLPLTKFLKTGTFGG